MKYQKGYDAMILLFAALSCIGIGYGDWEAMMIGVIGIWLYILLD